MTNSSSSPSIRLAIIDDTGEIVRLLTQSDGDAVLPPHEYVHSQLERFSNDPTRAIIVVEDAAQLIGMAVLTIIIKPHYDECIADKVVVDESRRGQGIGTALMEAAEAWAWYHNCKKIKLTSSPRREAANRLYQKRGFVIHETNAYENKNPHSQENES